MTRDQITTHLSQGGQLWRRVGRDRYFYKMMDGSLLCRVNELGGWHASRSSIDQIHRDELTIARADYNYNCYENVVTETRLPQQVITTHGAGLQTAPERQHHEWLHWRASQAGKG